MRLNDIRILLEEVAVAQPNALDLSWGYLYQLIIKTEVHYMAEQKRLNEGLTETEERRQTRLEDFIAKMAAVLGASEVHFPGDIRGCYSVSITFPSQKEVLFVHE